MFVAMYRWRVKPGKDEQFIRAWTNGTRSITKVYQSFGSRLHRADDGAYIGYAEWPSREAWQKAFDQHMRHEDREAARAFQDAIVHEESDLLFRLEIVSDELVKRVP